MVGRVLLAQFGEGGNELVALVRFRATGRLHDPAFVEPKAREDWRTRKVGTWSEAQEVSLVKAIKDDIAQRDRVRNGYFAEFADPNDLEIVLDAGRETERIIPGS